MVLFFFPWKTIRGTNRTDKREVLLIVKEKVMCISKTEYKKCHLSARATASYPKLLTTIFL